MTVGAAGDTGRNRGLIAAWIACGIGAAVALTGLVAVLRAVDVPAEARVPMGADLCLVGEWRETEHAEPVEVAGSGSVTIAGAGRMLRISGDGVQLVDYGDGASYEGGDRTHKVAVTFRGNVRYHVRAVAGLLTYDPMGAEGAVSVTVDGQQVEEAPFGGDTAPLSYSCGPDRLEEYDSTGYRSTFERVH